MLKYLKNIITIENITFFISISIQSIIFRYAKIMNIPYWQMLIWYIGLPIIYYIDYYINYYKTINKSTDQITDQTTDQTTNESTTDQTIDQAINESTTDQQTNQKLFLIPKKNNLLFSSVHIHIIIFYVLTSYVGIFSYVIDISMIFALHSLSYIFIYSYQLYLNFDIHNNPNKYGLELNDNRQQQPINIFKFYYKLYKKRVIFLLSIITFLITFIPIFYINTPNKIITIIFSVLYCMLVLFTAIRIILLSYNTPLININNKCKYPEYKCKNHDDNLVKLRKLINNGPYDQTNKEFKYYPLLLKYSEQELLYIKTTNIGNIEAYNKQILGIFMFRFSMYAIIITIPICIGMFLYEKDKQYILSFNPLVILLGLINVIVTYYGQYYNLTFQLNTEIYKYTLYASIRRMPLIFISSVWFSETISIFIWIAIGIQIISFIQESFYDKIKKCICIKHNHTYNYEVIHLE